MSPVKKPLAIKPVEFYGTGLPRPRFFDNPLRVDPPLPVLDPLLSWARDAHWSIGGLNLTRLRFQGRIDGKISKLRAQLDETPTKRNTSSGSESPPEAPTMYKRRRFMNLNEEDEESDDEGLGKIRRNLCDDFDRVAGELKKNSIASIVAVKQLRTSPRLAKKFRMS